VSFRPYANAKYVVETKKTTKRGYDPLKTYFVNYSANAAFPTTDTSGAQKFYNIGLFNFITASNAVTTETGELYVKYAFDMIRPKQEPTLNPPTAGVAAHISAPSITTGIFGSNGTWTQQDSTSSGITLANAVNGIKMGNLQTTSNYMAVWRVDTTTGTSTTSFTPSIVSGGVALNNQGIDTTYYTAALATSEDVALAMLSFTATAANPVLTTGSITVAGTTTADFWIFQIPTALVSVTAPIDTRLARLEKLLQRIPAHLLLDDEAEEKSTSPYVDVNNVGRSNRLVLPSISLPPTPGKPWFGARVAN